MGSIKDKLDYLEETKDLIKTAIEDKGISIADTDTFRDYATKIASIDGSGGNFITFVTDSGNISTNPFILEGKKPGLYFFINATNTVFMSTVYLRGGNSNTTNISFLPINGALLIINEYDASLPSNTNLALYLDSTFDSFASIYKSTGTSGLGTYSTLERSLMGVNLVSAQTISGKKTFSTLPESSVVPTTDNQLVNKTYVDSTIATQINNLNSFVDATSLIGWYGSSADGTNLTTEYGLEPSTVQSLVVGSKLEWPSTLETGVTNTATVIFCKGKTSYKPEGGMYFIKTIIIGSQPTFEYTYCYDEVEVYKNIWPDNTSGGNACFTTDTLVTTADNQIAIGDIKIGDKVLSANSTTNVTEFKEVVNIVKHDVSEVIEITVENETLRTTASHPFITKNRGEVIAKWLEVGDELIDNNAKEHKITNIKKVKTNETVYEILVKDNHNYYVGKNKVLVSNEPSVIYNK